MRHVYGSVFTLVFTFLGYFLAKCLVVNLWVWFGDLGRLLDFAKACLSRLDLFWFVWIFLGLLGLFEFGMLVLMCRACFSSAGFF